MSQLSTSSHPPTISSSATAFRGYPQYHRSMSSLSPSPPPLRIRTLNSKVDLLNRLRWELTGLACAAAFVAGLLYRIAAVTTNNIPSHADLLRKFLQ